MQITDAQIHLWAVGLPSNDAHIQTTSFTAADVIPMMDEAGVDAAVIHPPHWDPNSHELARNACRDHPGRFAIMGCPELVEAETKPLIASWRDTPGQLGLRFLMLGEDARRAFDSGDYDWLWAEAAEHDVPLALLCTDVLHGLGAVAERHPTLRITIDHFGGRGGNTKLKDHAAMAHMSSVLELAKHPNIAVKATGAPGYSAEDHPYPIMLDYTRQVYEAFGPERTFWGTDITKMPCSWRRCIDMMMDANWLTEDDKRLLMGAAVRDFWGWT